MDKVTNTWLPRLDNVLKRIAIVSSFALVKGYTVLLSACGIFRDATFFLAVRPQSRRHR
jgi:hypothetical protein